MIEGDNFLAFQCACSHGHQAIAEWVLGELSEKKNAMIEADHFGAFRMVCFHGFKDIAVWLLEQWPEKKNAMIEANCFAAFRMACRLGKPTATWLLEQSLSCFVYAEQHDDEYGNIYIHRFVTTRLVDLHERQEALLEANPNAIFDLEDETEKLLCFYMMRNLIRRNDGALLDELRFLLDIPAVNAQAANNANELLKLALSMANEEACAILLAIPAVRELAAQNNFYRDEQHAGVDLGALARDTESSMTALTRGEQKRLEKATAYYQPFMEQIGVPQLMSALREELESRYTQNPATIELDNGETMVLPLSWRDFQDLNLSFFDILNALNAYYQHTEHTALRYISKPNHWMADNAEYVYINQNSNERWSSFERYESLITLCWVAAYDTATPACDGHTLEGRQAHFIKELALIGRAHNWDKIHDVEYTRERIENGVKTEYKEWRKEEYDDLEGDKPSCFSGVKRRLFQSVIGHPLMSVLTEELLRQEIRDFLRTTFTERMTDDYYDALTMIYDKRIEGDDLDDEDIAVLNAFNLGQDEIASFLKSMTKKYDWQLTLSLKYFLKDMLSVQLCDAPNNAGAKTHLWFKHDGLINTASILSDYKKQGESILGKRKATTPQGPEKNKFLKALMIQGETPMMTMKPC